MTCPGSIRATEHLPDETSEYAAEGTVAHWVREMCLLYGFDPFDWVGTRMVQDGYEFEVTNEMAAFLLEGIERVDDIGGERFVEHRCDLSRWMPGQFGTLDTGIVTPDVIYIDDLKYGQGVEVEPFENKQLMIYALGFWDNIARHRTKATDFIISIDQPRAGGIKTWETTLDRLLEFGEEVRVAAARTYDEDAPFKASRKGCQWCRKRNVAPTDGAVSGCKTYDEYMLDFFGAQFEDLDDGGEIALPENLSGKRRWTIVQNASEIKKWLTHLHDESVLAAELGQPDPGSKLVAGAKASREWSDEERAKRILLGILRGEAFTRKLISPAQAEKALKPRRGFDGNPTAWDALNKLWTQAEGKPVLVPESSPKPALIPVTELFDDL